MYLKMEIANAIPIFKYMRNIAADLRFTMAKRISAAGVEVDLLTGPAR